MDFESMEVDSEEASNDPDRLLQERQRGLSREQIKSIQVVKVTAANVVELSG